MSASRVVILSSCAQQSAAHNVQIESQSALHIEDDIEIVQDRHLGHSSSGLNW